MHAGTFASLVVAFFRANPEDTLTLADAAVKFDFPGDVHKALARYLREGLLAMARGTQGPGPQRRLITAGPKIRQATEEERANPLQAVRLVYGIQPPRADDLLQADCRELLTTMLPLQATEPLPMALAIPLANAIAIEHKARAALYQLAPIDTTTVRVFRTA